MRPAITSFLGAFRVLLAGGPDEAGAEVPPTAPAVGDPAATADEPADDFEVPPAAGGFEEVHEAVLASTKAVTASSIHRTVDPTRTASPDLALK
jgi:hypothetical protein